MRSAPLVEAARADGTGTRTASVLGLGHHLPETVVNNLPIAERQRKYRWPLGRRPDDHPGLSDLGL